MVETRAYRAILAVREARSPNRWTDLQGRMDRLQLHRVTFDYLFDWMPDYVRLDETGEPVRWPRLVDAIERVCTGPYVSGRGASSLGRPRGAADPPLERSWGVSSPTG